MYQEINLTLSPSEAFEKSVFEEILKDNLSESIENFKYRKLKQSIDARGREVKVHVQAALFMDEEPSPIISYNLKEISTVKSNDTALIIGAGPAGLFAALRLIELGIKPILIERGKDVRARRRDIAAINKDHIVNPESNYCFGEGGAGTYSDGKLYTRSKKRGDLLRILEILVAHGAPEDILYESHPHIGTNKLPTIVANIRNTILEKGGEIHFETKLTQFLLNNKKVVGVVVNNEKEIVANAVILATGHSARDIFEICKKQNISIEAKPFAIGVRVEHPQSMIDAAQYSLEKRGDYLPAASYSLVSQVKTNRIQKGVFSFCMCPGGFIVPSATSPGELVVNGMSPSRRDSKFANSGIVVAIDENDWKKFNEYEELAAMKFQASIEENTCKIMGGKQFAPAQLVGDFIHNKLSSDLAETSYQPGIKSANFMDILPENIAVPLQIGLADFGKKIRGFSTNQGQIVGIESRTSSPVRIPRDKETLEHIHIKRLFPCGEGAGYAGGIVSAAMDGERCAEKLF
ncbi:MAG: FAD-dependent oxidoreductase, partial [Bacteroidota bacterium]